MDQDESPKKDDLTSRILERTKNRRRLSSKLKSSSPPADPATSSGGNGGSAEGNPRIEDRSAGDGISRSEDEDDEVEELSRLRCPSVATEVVAAAEQRRRERQRRCADYPGLSLGTSIFSSDTIMKLNIIKNELHNILNSQLRRVSQKTRQMSISNCCQAVFTSNCPHCLQVGIS